ncbi:uncharacterized protein with beta-barrel porin domain [Lysobacter niastensis]|uniref:Uncharacterized protein with beta-barrel porin domain n=1 Tax=Lysobacter niastensis TaxID=380629 RepID=A0ABU1WD52_9GAMM|nr:autotransporter domain-containing protein [Lysobacter niastensis]MDR7135406.1 uncharacterized protein with beta-barrel porin domain [Lysobacter niastensis]
MNPLLHWTRLAGLAGMLLLAACGGGGQAVRSDPVPAVVAPPPAPPPPPPPPQPSPTALCPSPITADCYVKVDYTLTWNEIKMTGGRQSDHALIVDGTGWLNLVDGEYRFGGGTQIAGGELVVWDTLVSDVKIFDTGFSPGGTLWLTGTVRGDVDNRNLLSTRHKCGTGLSVCAEDRHSRIEGDYSQVAWGTLELVLGWDLQITGSAALDGKLRLIKGTSQSYVLPSASSVLLLHAAEGVTGQFDEWAAQGLFLEGALRYTANDVFFDATRISVASAMSTAGVAGPVELASADNLDRAFEQADRFARLPPSALNQAQQRFLDSAASIQHIRDHDQALRTLDSLGGRIHAQMPEAIGHQASAHARQLDAHLERLTPATAGAWSAPMEYRAQGAGGAGHIGGHDAWFGPNWLVGGSVALGSSWMQFDSLGGQADGPSPSANLYAQYRDAGGRWYATGMLGMTDASLRIQRGIDLGDAGVHTAYSQRRIGQAYMQGEIGRRFQVGRGRLSPFLGLDYAGSRDDGFVEQGETGLELIADPTSASFMHGTAGARYARDWRLGAKGWLQFDLDARYRHRLADHGTTPRAAFAAIPEVRFDLPAWPQQQDSGSVSLGLLAGIGEWTGTLDHTRQFSADVPDAGWWLGLQRDF